MLILNFSSSYRVYLILCRKLLILSSSMEIILILPSSIAAHGDAFTVLWFIMLTAFTLTFLFAGFSDTSS